MAGFPRAAHRVAALGLLAAVALLVASLPAAAFVQSANVVITADRSGYRVGDLANVTLRTFELGDPVDPTTLGLVVAPSTTYARSVNLTREAVGVYGAAIQIQPTDVGPISPDGSGSVALQATAVIGSLTDEENGSLPILAQFVPGFAIATSSDRAAPGATLSLTLRTTVDGVPRDASYLAVTAYLSSSSGGSASRELAVTNVSVGNYTASYTIPAGVAAPGVVRFAAAATVVGMALNRTATVTVPGTEPFQIWAYQSVFSPPTAIFTVFVGDASGGFVSGANVSLTYTYASSTTGFQDATYPSAATTDLYGRATFRLDLHGSIDVFDVTYRGNVTEGAERQYFVGVLYVLSSGPTAAFAIVRTNPEAFSDVNDTAQLNYTVYVAGVPVSGLRVVYYAQTDLAFLAAGNVTTDANGSFQLSVPIRAGLDRILLTARTGTTWHSLLDFVTPVHPLDVETGPVAVGRVIPVNVTYASAGPWYTSVDLMPYVPSTEASPWLPISGFFAAEPVSQSGTRVSYNLSIARFLPKDADYLLYAVAIPESALTSGTSGEAYAYSRIVHITNVPAYVRAHLSTSTAGTGEAVLVDASSSSDLDGFIAAYRVAWGDGNLTDWTSAPVFTHRYAAPGDYLVSVSAEDDSGAVSITQMTVHVEPSILGLRQSVAIPHFVGIAAAGAAGLAAVWWRRRIRARIRTPPPGMPPAPPTGPGGSEPPAVGP